MADPLCETSIGFTFSLVHFGHEGLGMPIEYAPSCLVITMFLIFSGGQTGSLLLTLIPLLLTETFFPALAFKIGMIFVTI